MNDLPAAALNSIQSSESSSRRTFLKSAAALAATTAAWKSVAASESEKKPAAVEPFNLDRDPLLISTHPSVIRGRDAALEILKPTTKQLEHGLELHRRSLVFDTYGFAPRASVDGDALAKLEADGASDEELTDAREEFSMTRAALDPRERQEFLDAMQVAGVTCIFQNAGEEGNDPLLLIRRLARFTYLCDHLRGVLNRASLPQDIEAARAAGQHCLYLTGNGIPLSVNPSNVMQDLGFVRLFFQLGVRMMHLTYNRRNLLGDGCAETANAGLSDFGRVAIKEMNRVGVIVDVAHSGWQTSLEAAKESSKPMVASHTTCKELNEHIRSKPDEVIRAICDTGGMVGICCIPNFLGGTGGIAELVNHIDYVAKKFGVDHVGIGTDISHTSQYSGAESGKVKSRGKRRPRFAQLWPAGALGGNWPASRSLAWTNWPLFTVGLVQKGYSDEDIQKILGGNMMRVCRDVLPS